MSKQLSEWDECERVGIQILNLALGTIERVQHSTDINVRSALSALIHCIAGLIDPEDYFLLDHQQVALARIYNAKLWLIRDLRVDEALLECAKRILPAHHGLETLFRIMENCLVSIQSNEEHGVKDPRCEGLLEQAKAEVRLSIELTSGAEAEDFEQREKIDAVLEYWAVQQDQLVLTDLARDLQRTWRREDTEYT